MNTIKVVSAKEMARVEGLSYAKGCNEFAFMERAGASVSACIETFIEARDLPRTVTVLVGKGNNGGDGYVIAAKLSEKGFRVEVFSVYPADLYGPLCRHQFERFEKMNGKVRFGREGKEIVFAQEGVLVDAILGTGFKGASEGFLAEVIDRANASGLPIIAVDIPSGLCGNTGKVETVAIKAAETVYLELPKIGFFLDRGWDHVGILVQGRFGLPPEYIASAEAEALLVEETGWKNLMPPLKRTGNKYESGYVVTLAGSSSMIGAGILASYASLRSGAGIVRWFYPEESEASVASAPWTVIKEPLDFMGMDRVLEEFKRADCLVIGPGMGRGKHSFKKIKGVLSRCTIPCIVDADALFFLSEHPSFTLPKKTVLTPHKGELKRLLKAKSLSDEPFLSGCRTLAKMMNAHILVKGAPNFLFTPEETVHILPFGNPGMATAGTGDVLAGVLGALVARKIPLLEAVVLGCALHGTAGDFAAEEKSSFCMTALDLLECLPKAFQKLLK